MSWGEEQQKEIETIRERKITVKLSDADCDRLARKCGKHGLTIGELNEKYTEQTKLLENRESERYPASSITLYAKWDKIWE